MRVSVDPTKKDRTHRRGAPKGYPFASWMLAMADDVTLAPLGGAGRPRRPYGTPLRQLKARVGEEAVERAHRAAAALGVTMAEYVEALLLHDEPGLDGRPVWWSKPTRRDQEVLPLGESA